MPRTVFGVALALGLVVALGCGSGSDQPLPKVALEGEPTPTPPAPSPNPDPAPPPKAEMADSVPKAEAPKGPVWEGDPDKHVVPTTAVRGSIGGVDVTPEVLIETGELVFRTLKAGTTTVERKVSLKLTPAPTAEKPAQPILGRTWKVRLESEPGPLVPEIWLEDEGKAIQLYPGGYALSLELGPRKDGKVTGKVYLSIPDAKKTVLAGTFTADYFRPHTERPGPDDAPYVTGTVTVTGTQAGAEVRVGYAGFNSAGPIFKELQLGFDPAPEAEARWLPDDSDRPRASRLIAGDGKGRPFRYEHLKLPPGRYLLSAAVAGGPAVWKWVDVPAGGALTEHFVLDATKTGGVEVNAAPGATDKVLLAPVDDPNKPALEESLFQAVAFQVVRQEVALIGGKAVVKNLAPGKYEVRVGTERRTVEVVAGKVAELDLSAPKKAP
ncbi:hypothetical protein [Frigoriglobus tundricola]|uniref:Lipoprotein n=1 Tax=Frigoriglobus tundricola TaxID=2774151 RepID=A0A6M5Z518_9BACT|nr:hypothetical protein [Frigoriglobus tundricola]QJX00561.1 hypothetical protein FTUN_8191 [Frigoriglobus tundricola]